MPVKCTRSSICAGGAGIDTSLKLFLKFLENYFMNCGGGKFGKNLKYVFILELLWENNKKIEKNYGKIDIDTSLNKYDGQVMLKLKIE